MAIPPITSWQDSLNERLGADLKFPLGGSFTPIAGLDVLIQDIQTILLTIPGERVNRPDFGSGLRTLVWENLDEAALLGKAMIKESLSQWEPRILVTAVEVNINRNSDLLTFLIKFTVLSTDINASLVFPFRSSQDISSQ